MEEEEVEVMDMEVVEEEVEVMDMEVEVVVEVMAVDMENKKIIKTFEWKMKYLLYLK